MKIDNGKHQFERRRKRFITPIIYMLAEFTLAWLLLSMVNISFQIQTWNSLSHIALGCAFFYSAYKTYGIFERQKDYKRSSWGELF